MDALSAKNTAGTRRGRPLPLLVAGFCLVFLPGLASAEGARRYFDCTLVQRCDAAGACTPDAGEVLFELEPQAVASDGSGSYLLRYDNVETAMRALSEAGPFHWTLDSERHTLLASSETRFLWHRLFLAGTPEASILFLDCALRY